MTSNTTIHLVLLIVLLLVLIGTSTCQKGNKRQPEEEEEEKTTKAVTGTVVREGKKRFENCSLLSTDREVARDGASQDSRDGASSDRSEIRPKDGAPPRLDGKLGKLFEVCKLSPTLQWDGFVTNHLSLRIISSLYEKLTDETTPDKCPSFVSETAQSMICDLVHGYVESEHYNYDYDRYNYDHYDISSENDPKGKDNDPKGKDNDPKGNDHDLKENDHDHDSETFENEFFKPYLKGNWKQLFNSHFREH